MRSKHKTILLEVVDEDKFRAQWSILCDSMCNGREIDGAVVVALSHEDEFARIEELEEGLLE